MFQGLLIGLAVLGLPVVGGEDPCPDDMDQPVAACAGAGWMDFSEEAVAPVATVADDDEELDRMLRELTERALRLERELREMRETLGEMLEEHGDEIADRVEDAFGGVVEEFIAPRGPEGGEPRFRFDVRRHQGGDDGIGGEIRRALREWRGPRGERRAAPRAEGRMRFQGGPAGCDACKLCPEHQAMRGRRWVGAPGPEGAPRQFLFRMTPEGDVEDIFRQHRDLLAPGHGEVHRESFLEIHPKIEREGKIVIEHDGERLEVPIAPDGADDHGELFLRLHESGDIEEIHEELMKLHEGGDMKALHELLKGAHGDIDVEVETHQGEDGKRIIIIENDGERKVIENEVFLETRPEKIGSNRNFY